MSAVFGMQVILSRHVKWDEAYVIHDGQAVVLHGLRPLPTDELFARWWSETPADHARRIVHEVLEWHAAGPDPALAAAAVAELEHRLAPPTGANR